MTRFRFVLLALLTLAPVVPAPSAAPPEVPPVPDPLALPGDALASTTAADARLLLEEFGGPLADSGWTVERLAGSGAGWRLADGATLAGANLTTGVATTAGLDGRAPDGFDARLASPVLAWSATPAARVPSSSVPPAPEALAAGANATAALRENASAGASSRAAYEDARTVVLWPPGENLTRERADVAALAPAPPNASRAPDVRVAAESPAAPPPSAARMSLRVRHAWDFAPGDGGFLEARVVEDGAWSAWRVVPTEPAVEHAITAAPLVAPPASEAYRAHLPTGEHAFTGLSNATVSVFDLSGYAGATFQLAFRARSSGTLPPQGFGWAIDLLEIRGALSPEPDLAVERFVGLEDGDALALAAVHDVRVLVRNWGAATVRGAELVVEARTENGGNASGFPARVPLETLTPGEVRVVRAPSPLADSRADNVTLVARAVLPLGAPDVRPANDAATIAIRLADVMRAALTLDEDDASLVDGVGATKAFRVTAANAGNRDGAGALRLVGVPVHLANGTTKGPARTLAETTIDLPPPAGRVARAPSPGAAETFAALTWVPAAADRGAWLVRAEWTPVEGPASASSSALTYVDVAPAPVLDEPFRAARADHTAYAPSSLSLLDGWSADAWTIRDGRVEPLPVESAAGTRHLAVRAADAAVGAGLDRLERAARDLDEGVLLARLNAPAPISTVAVLPDGMSLADVPVAAPILHAPHGKVWTLNLTGARLLHAAHDVACRPNPDTPQPTPPTTPTAVPQGPVALAKETVATVNAFTQRLESAVHCEDAESREPVPLDVLLESAVRVEELGLASSPATIDLREARAATGDEGVLYVIVDADIDPGISLWWSPLVVTVGEGAPVASLPGGELRPYAIDGVNRCCVVGPFRAADALEAARAAVDAIPPAPVVAATEAARITGVYATSRALHDLLGGVRADETEMALAFEHRGEIAWSDGRGVRGRVDVETNLSQVVATRSFESDVDGWTTVLLPVPRNAGAARVRLTLEALDGAALADCAYLDPRAECDPGVRWRVDDLRVLARRTANDSWRVVARDGVEDDDARWRWTGDAAIANASAPAADARGWIVADSGLAAPHRASLPDAGLVVDAEANATRALRWGETGSLRTAAREPLWTVVSTPALDLSRLSAPRVTLATRYDFGPESRGAFGAGGAVVARLEPVAGGPVRRVLLEPAAGDAEGSAYRGGVEAPAFLALARALRVEVPPKAAATALVGASGVALGEVGEAAWVRLAVPLDAIRPLLVDHRVAFELHAVTAAPLETVGWIVDDVAVGEPGPARDLALAGLPTVPATGVAPGEPVRIAVNLTNLGLLPSRGVQIEVAVRNATGGPVYPDPATTKPWRPLVLRLPDAGVGAPPAGVRDGEPTIVAVELPGAWTPTRVGQYCVTARVRVTGGDDRPANDMSVRCLRVANVTDVRLSAAEDALSAREGVARVGEPMDVRLAVDNRGTLTYGAARPLAVEIQIEDAAGRPEFDPARRIDVAAVTGGALRPGRHADLELRDFWTPPASGHYRMVARLVGENVTAPEVVAGVLVEDAFAALDPDAVRPTGAGWRNASRGAEGSIGWFDPRGGAAAGSLALAAPLNLRTASRATLRVVHEYDFEDGFDGGVVEVRTPNSTWTPLAPASGLPGTLIAPSALSPDGAPTPAFTGSSRGARADEFDLASIDALRENATLSINFTAAASSLLANASPALHAGPRAPPADAPEGAAAHVRRDYAARELHVPANATGDLVLRVDEWRAIGIPGSEATPPSGVAWRLLGGACATPNGVEVPIEAPQTSPYANNVRGWRSRTIEIPGGGTTLAGGAACLVVEHREVASRVPERLALVNRTTPEFDSGIVSPHGGYAFARAELSVAATGHLLVAATNSTANLTTDWRRSTTSRWLAPGEGVPAEPLPAPDGAGFVPLPAPPVPLSTEGAWTARASDGLEARAVAPLDLTAAVWNATLVLRARHTLTLVHGEAANATGGASLAGALASADGGRTWIPLRLDAPEPVAAFTTDGDPAGSRHSEFAGPRADPEGDSPAGPGGAALSGDSTGWAEARYDLRPFLGRPILVALAASFTSSPAALADFFEVSSARVDTHLLRGTDVDLRFRAASDATGPSAGWTIRAAEVTVVRHAPGLALRYHGPGPATFQEGYRTVVLEVVNRGPDGFGGGSVAIGVEHDSFEGRRSFEASRDVPPLASGASAFVTLRTADYNWFVAANVTPARLVASVAPIEGETLTTDNAVGVLVGGIGHAVERSVLRPLRLEATPSVVDLTDPSRGSVTLHVAAPNDGEEATALGPSRVRVYRETKPVVTLTDARASASRVEGGAPLDVVWLWKPSASSKRGSYRLEADVVTGSGATAPNVTVMGALHVGGPYLRDWAYLERFGAASGQPETRAGWRCTGAPPCAREDAAAFASAPVSLRIGLASTEAGATNRTGIASPEFPVANMTSAVLRARFSASLPAGEVARVEAQPVRADGTRGAWTTISEMRGVTPGFADGAFRADEWNVTALLPARAIVLRVDAPRLATGGVWLDDVSVTALDVAVAPPPVATVRDGVEKRLRLTVENRGTLSDAYALAFRDARGAATALPAGWTARLVDPLTGRTLADAGRAGGARLTVPANASRAVDLVVTTAPSGATGPLRGPVAIPFEVASTLLPTLVRHARADLVAAGAPRADLVIVDVRSASTEPVGRGRAVDVTIANRGLAAATAPVTLVAEPPGETGEAPAALATPDGEESPVVSLAPGASRTVTFAWTPRDAGAHRLVARADPAGEVVELDRANNRLARDVHVAPVPAVDLRVAIALDDEAPARGAPAELALTVLNAGTTTARGVEVRLRAGVLDILDGAPPHAIADVEPNETRTIRVTWTPDVAGETRITAAAYARAGAPEPVETLEDNAASLTRFVREEAARVRALPSPPPAPDGLVRARFTLTNAGNANESYALAASAPDGWVAAVEVDGARAAVATLSPGASARVDVVALPPPDPLAGDVSLGLAATPATGGPARRATGVGVVPASREVEVAIAPASVNPEDAFLEVVIANRGNAPQHVVFAHVDDEFPVAWTLEGFVVDAPPFTTVRERLALDLGDDDAPGRRALKLRWLTEDADGTLRARPVVAESRRLVVNATATAVAGGTGRVAVEFANAGNVAVSAVVTLALPPGFSSPLDGVAVALAPGERARREGVLVAPLDAPANATARAIVRADGDAASFPFEIPVARADLAVESAEATDAPGRYTALVANRGDVPLVGVAVDLYAGERLVAAAPVGDLEPGAAADATLAWADAPVGAHGLSVVARTASPVTDADATNDALAVGELRVAGPDGVAGLVRQVPLHPHALALALALALSGRRRR